MNKVTQVLEAVLSHDLLHAKWLNTLSYMENCGARLIAACEHPTLVPKEVLKHAAEEFRHAYFFKSQIEKVYPPSLSRYRAKELLGGYRTRHYLYRLNAKISRWLLFEKGVYGDLLKEYAYLLVTYAIEVRAEVLYPIYQSLLEDRGVPISINGIIRDEAHHLKEIQEEMTEKEILGWGEEACAMEESLFAYWLQAIQLEVQHAEQPLCT